MAQLRAPLGPLADTAHVPVALETLVVVGNLEARHARCFRIGVTVADLAGKEAVASRVPELSALDGMARTAP